MKNHKASKPKGVWIAGNWKMNHSPQESVRFFDEIQKAQASVLSPTTHDVLRSGSLKALLFPNYLALEKSLQKTAQLPFKVSIGAQTAHGELSGAYTGEVSGPMLSEIGVRSTLIGHSERRQFFGDTDESIQKRLEGLLPQGFQVIFCIGETRSEREAGKTHEVLKRQILKAISQEPRGAAPYLNGQLLIAYEPVWAIGTGLTATPAQAEEAHAFIAQTLETHFGKKATQSTPLLYGGSVNTNHLAELLECTHVDGALIGGASLKPLSFLQLLELGGQAL